MRALVSSRPALHPAVPVVRLAVALLGIAWIGAGCATFRAARLYDAGTRALDRGELARAIGDLERAAALAPQASEIQNHLGLAYAAAGRPDDAHRAFERALALDCGNEAARHNLRVAEEAP
jgi:Flp pilus assembly protein TadD